MCKTSTDSKARFYLSLNYMVPLFNKLAQQIYPSNNLKITVKNNSNSGQFERKT